MPGVAVRKMTSMSFDNGQEVKLLLLLAVEKEDRFLCMEEKKSSPCNTVASTLINYPSIIMNCAPNLSLLYETLLIINSRLINNCPITVPI
jgi:hypothetical protein